jgi:hypothetical protein
MEALPTQAMRDSRYYHGTTSTAAALAIMQQGLKGQESQGRGKMAPVVGRVYLTPHIDYAIIYALGGDYKSSMLEAKDYSDPYGYVFVVKGADLVDVQPDEDSVGEWLSDNSKPIKIQARNYQTGAPLLDKEGNPVMRTSGYECGFPMGSPDAILWHNVRVGFTDKQFDAAMNGEYDAWASGGKRALKKLSDESKIALINHGAHVAHGGAIHPSECWRILKADMKKLKRDGSNFFTIAERFTGA